MCGEMMVVGWIHKPSVIRGIKAGSEYTSELFGEGSDFYIYFLYYIF